jgi:hypothetical protein
MNKHAKSVGVFYEPDFFGMGVFEDVPENQGVIFSCIKLACFIQPSELFRCGTLV